MSIKVSPEAFLAAYSDYIVIVGITEADIQDLDHYPISDRVLAQVLSQILAANPVVVGLEESDSSSVGLTQRLYL